MREKKIYLLATAILIGAFLFASINVREAKAQAQPTALYLDNVTSRTTTIYYPATNPIIIARRTSTGTFNIFLRIARAAHQTHEPVDPLTDVTYGWAARMSWDPAYFTVTGASALVSSDTVGNFLYRRYYVWNDPDMTPETGDEFWSYELGRYPTTGIAVSIDATAGNLLMSEGLLGFDPNTTPLPAEYFDAYAGLYAPDKGRQLGSYYDLPYTENLTQVVTQPDTTSVTDPNYNTLVRITITQHTLTPTSGYATAFHLYDTLLFTRDGTHTYTHQTFDIYYQGIPVVPEFPLGITPLLLLAPAIPVVYMWRIRKKVRKQ